MGQVERHSGGGGFEQRIELKLLEIQYRDLLDCCQDEEEWRKGHPLLCSITPERRLEIVHDLLDRMRKALCIKTIYLDPNFQDQIRNRSEAGHQQLIAFQLLARPDRERMLARQPHGLPLHRSVGTGLNRNQECEPELLLRRRQAQSRVVISRHCNR